MKTKNKITIISIITVLALSVIGLAIGMVLVARQANLGNTMTVSYQANNVDATITASGKVFADNTTNAGSVIKLSDNSNSKTITFNAADSEADVIAKGTNAVSFSDIELTATGRAEYYFAITNTASTQNTRNLTFTATTNNTSNNVDVKLAHRKSNLFSEYWDEYTEAVSSSTSYTTHSSNTITQSVGSGQETVELVVIISVADPTMDVEKTSINLDISLDYNHNFALSTELCAGCNMGYYGGTIDTSVKKNGQILESSSMQTICEGYMVGGSTTPATNKNAVNFAPITLSSSDTIVFTYNFTNENASFTDISIDSNQLSSDFVTYIGTDESNIAPLTSSNKYTYLEGENLTFVVVVQLTNSVSSATLTGLYCSIRIG